jgi:LysR family glycine cleavage system transcriptional activator
MGSLRAFEAAARLGSFTAAAHDLNITQSAVSQAVQQLEGLIATPLFERFPGRLALTAAGRRYAQALGPLLESIAAATAELTDAQAGRLSIGCIRSILQRWLLARLPRFQAEHPDVALDVVALGVLDEALEAATECDVAIILADEHARPAGARRLAAERLIAVASPGVAQAFGAPLEMMPALPPVPRLGSGWDRWFEEAGLAAPEAPGSAIQLREVSTVVQAALEGQGIALIGWLACLDDLAAGRLVRVSEIAVDRGRSYWLVRPPARRSPAAAMFADWLAAEVPPELRARR